MQESAAFLWTWGILRTLFGLLSLIVVHWAIFHYMKYLVDIGPWVVMVRQNYSSVEKS
jgi:hypothetical protein